MKTYLVIVGVGLLVLAVALLLRRMTALVRGASAIGRVQGHEARITDDQEVAYLPVVEFTDSYGQIHRFTSVAGSSNRRPDTGTEVPVRYLPSNPEIAYIQSFLHMWAAPIACAALGLAALAVVWRL